jgi:adenine deaminase
MKKINRRKFIQSSSLLGASGLLFGFSSTQHIFMSSKGFDILIKNGSVIDGTGKKEFISNLGIKDGKILAIGNLSSADADMIIDANGFKVVPGFIKVLRS